MNDARAESGLPKEPFDRRGVFAIAFFQDFYCGNAPLRVLGAVYCGSATFTDSLQ
jgi:hypothetical protein